MPITAGAACDKIIELRSKLAIYSSWVDLIHSNYMPSDGGDPEVFIARKEDGGNATEAHFRSVLEDIERMTAEIKEELGEVEALLFEPRVADVTPLHSAQDRAKKPPERKQPRRAQPASPAK